ncbi:MAG: tRNA lysidine(34) synthetase TilS [Alphaproteobacteria bacterium]
MNPGPPRAAPAVIETSPAPPPIEAREFASLMAPLGPFESQPRIAVAVSGGADSMALALLADRWARDRGGRITALTVDHGLRQGSAEEARTVAGWLGARDIAHQSLQWRGAKPRTGRQAAAREARYALMQAWCRQQDCLHLLLAHHRHDQAETHLIRLEAGSGGDGLAAMAAISERRHLRLLRPLLGVDKARLRASLIARSQDWTEDPSNRDPAYARSRLRADGGASVQDHQARIRSLGRRRAAVEGETASLLARIARFDNAGYCRFEPTALAAADPRLARRALARMLVTASGSVHAPRGERLDRLLDALAGARLEAGLTLGGCRIVPFRGDIMVCREPAAARERIAITGTGAYRWDNRFTLRIDAISTGAYEIARLGRDGWAQLTQADPRHRASPIPPPVRPSLPGLFAGSRLIAAPHFGFAARGQAGGGEIMVCGQFEPTMPLAGPVFGVV